MNVAVGSLNQAKISAVEIALKELRFNDVTVLSVDAPSNVSDMPFSDVETMTGAKNRALSSLKHSSADMAIGLEGGVMETELGLFLCNWGALAHANQPIIYAGGARIQLPETVADRLREGEVLGQVMDDYCNKKDVSKQEGAIGIFTNGAIDRSSMFVHIVKMLIGQSVMYK